MARQCIGILYIAPETSEFTVVRVGVPFPLGASIAPIFHVTGPFDNGSIFDFENIKSPEYWGRNGGTGTDELETSLHNTLNGAPPPPGWPWK